MRLDYLQDVGMVSRIPALSTILRVLTRSTGTRLAMLAKVEAERWVACSIEDQLGTSFAAGMEMDVKSTICYDVLRSGSPIVVNDVDKDAVYCDHVSPRTHGFRSFITVPVVLPEGAFFGTLSCVDPDPLVLDDPETLASVRLLSDLIGFHIQAELDLQRSEAMLVNEQQISQLREQFIALLAQDLRDPLASVAAGARMIAGMPEQTARIAGNMASSVGHMNGLIDEVTDFARARTGHGLPAQEPHGHSLNDALLQVVQEFRSARPDRSIAADIAVEAALSCHHALLAQLASNLLGNALLHGSGVGPVAIKAGVVEGVFALAVTSGSPSDDRNVQASREDTILRDPSARQEASFELPVASNIAKAHGGHIDVVSSDGLTCVTVRIPVQRVKGEKALLFGHHQPFQVHVPAPPAL